ncbi:MAG: SsrA-binding protein SmpB [Anaerolineae bacterium]|nr:SsrA-binding protein SmpB [Anaerolineae bacterium]
MTGRKIVTRNRKASHDYHLMDTYEAGIVLTGTEIKSIRANQINIGEGFVQEQGGELWLMGVHITPYKQASRFDAVDPLRPRKLLLKKKEIARVISQLRERGYTVVPTMIYLERGLAKVEIALAKGKKLYDKREALSKRDSDREIQRALKDRY